MPPFIDSGETHDEPTCRLPQSSDDLQLVETLILATYNDSATALREPLCWCRRVGPSPLIMTCRQGTETPRTRLPRGITTGMSYAAKPAQRARRRRQVDDRDDGDDSAPEALPQRAAVLVHKPALATKRNSSATSPTGLAPAPGGDRHYAPRPNDAQHRPIRRPHSNTHKRTSPAGDQSDERFVAARTDVLLGRRGNDNLTGAADNDLLCGGNGDGKLGGGDGTNSLFGGRGNDRLTGGPGTDTVNDGPGNDVLRCEACESRPGGDCYVRSR